MRLLITGAAGKVGTQVRAILGNDDRFAAWNVRALCHNRLVKGAGIEVVQGSLSDADAARRAMEGVSHVLHLAAVKESPALAMDVGVKGMFNLLEAFRASDIARQFILLGGDCSIGHIFHSYDGPITEDSPRRAYPGCYALTKVLEEVMLEQYRIQYGLNTCCLRAPWIMEKDDFRHAMSFDDQFGGPAWSELMPEAALQAAKARPSVPLMLDHQGRPLLRSFVHVSDLVSAILKALDNPAAEGQLFNITMDAPVDYGDVSRHLATTRGYEPVTIPTGFYGNWMSNAKARQVLGWQPAMDTEALIESAWTYHRAADDPRQIWYPG
ncbi:MAG: NAD(P)-dependent oxidoreductase [Cereibacter sphaeroides]|uniref:NAD(P)-dependent oxidoreductase n=1 Tax=Cereibacter sphaeroides TaxID=1063 RepID=A0A2W5S4A1_CERSP|nr:MAG: NAD(P)-dependent oxidoreductase [Cereibacter sphaeroides]